MCNTAILPQDFYMAMPWEWAELDESESDQFFYSIAERIIDANGLYVSKKVPGADSFHQMIYQGIRFGYCEQAKYMFKAFQYNINEMHSRYNLDEDGTIYAENLWAVNEIYSNISTLFSNVVASGRHLTERMGRIVKKLYGVDSLRWKTWRWYETLFYDSLIGYALCDRYRNIALHSFTMLSIVNYRPSSSTVGVTINLESGLLSESGLGKNLKDRLLAFRQERREQGYDPWFSLGGIINDYDLGITCLYTIFSRIMLDDINDNPFSDRVLSEIDLYDSIYWSNAASKKQYSIARCYLIVKDINIKSIRRNMRGAASHAKSINSEMGNMMRLIASCKGAYMIDEDNV